jgi:hypothetical protein
LERIAFRDVQNATFLNRSPASSLDQRFTLREILDRISQFTQQQRLELEALLHSLLDQNGENRRTDFERIVIIFGGQRYQNTLCGLAEW